MTAPSFLEVFLGVRLEEAARLRAVRIRRQYLCECGTISTFTARLGQIRIPSPGHSTWKRAGFGAETRAARARTELNNILYARDAQQAHAVFQGDFFWSGTHIASISRRTPEHRTCDCCGQAVLNWQGNAHQVSFQAGGHVGTLTLCSVCRSWVNNYIPRCRSCNTHTMERNPVNGYCPACDVVHMTAELATQTHEQQLVLNVRVLPAAFRTCRQCRTVETLNRLGGTTPICNACLSTTRTENCSHCGQLHLEADTRTVDGRRLCLSCVRSQSFRCNHCGELHLAGDRRPNRYSNLCSRCFEAHYVVCDRCNGLYLHESMSEENPDYCRSCAEESERERLGELINNYSYKPMPIFHGNASKFEAHMGLEIEVQAQHKFNTAEAVRRYDEQREYVYCKYDSTVDVEIVTHPATLGEHRARLPELLEKVQATGARGFSTNGMSCGIHIHVSRAPFKHTDLIKAYLFVNRCHAQWAAVGRRRSEYANYAAPHREDTHTKRRKVSGDMNRYEAVNFQPRRTWEVRLFRSTTNTQSALAYVESIHALSGWLLSRSAPGLGRMTWAEPDTLWGDFTAYIQDDPKAYRENLVPFLSQLNLM